MPEFDSPPSPLPPSLLSSSLPTLPGLQRQASLKLGQERGRIDLVENALVLVGGAEGEREGGRKKGVENVN